MTTHSDDQEDDRRMFQRRGSDRADDSIDGSRIRVNWQVVAWALGVIVTALMTYNATANNMNARVSVLESQKVEMKNQIDRMNDKLDRLIDLAQARR